MTIVGPPLLMAHSDPGIGLQYHNNRTSLKSVVCEGSNLKTMYLHLQWRIRVT